MSSKIPRYRVLMHRKVSKSLTSLEEKLKERMVTAIEKLVDYPLALRELDAEKLEGLERTYRIRIGDYRVIFYVDKKDKTIYVTHLGRRESIYQ